MPTPESAAFLAKKPTVPPTFDGVDYEDTTRLKQAQDAIVREQWVKVMMGRLVREELGKCYYREGVNHLEKCGHLRGQSEDEMASQRWVQRACNGPARSFKALRTYLAYLLTVCNRAIPPVAQGEPGQGLPV